MSKASGLIEFIQNAAKFNGSKFEIYERVDGKICLYLDLDVTSRSIAVSRKDWHRNKVSYLRKLAKIASLAVDIYRENSDVFQFLETTESNEPLAATFDEQLFGYRFMHKHCDLSLLINESKAVVVLHDRDCSLEFNSYKQAISYLDSPK